MRVDFIPKRIRKNALLFPLFAFVLLIISSAPSMAQIEIKSGDEYKDQAKDLGLLSMPFNLNDFLLPYEGTRSFSWETFTSIKLYNCIGEKFLYKITENSKIINNLKDGNYYTIVAYDVEPRGNYGNYKIREGYYFNINNIVVEDGNRHRIKIPEIDFRSSVRSYLPVTYFNKITEKLKGKRVIICYNSEVMNNELNGEPILIHNQSKRIDKLVQEEEIVKLFSNYVCEDIVLLEGYDYLVAIIRDLATNNKFGICIVDVKKKEIPDAPSWFTPEIIPTHIVGFRAQSIIIEEDYREAAEAYEYLLEYGRKWMKEQSEAIKKKKLERAKDERVSKYGIAFASKIEKKEVVTGMTPEMVIDAWGHPWAGKEVRKSNEGEVEIWDYYWVKVLFIDGKVNEVKNIKHN